MSASILQERLLSHPPARVWRALTEAELVGRWLMPNDLRAEEGARFRMDTGSWGSIECEVLVVEPERLLVYTWRNPPLDTIVTWRLVPEGEGTRLFLEHAGFDLDHPQQRFAHQQMGGGWGQIAERLRATLDALSA